MRIVFALFVAAHGAIHLLGFVKGVGLAEVPALRSPVSHRAGWVWFLAALLLMVAAAFFLWAPRWWWIPALVGVVLSQVLILGAWSDARFGTVANVVVLLPLILSMVDARPESLRSRFRSEATMAITDSGPGSAAPPPVTQADLEGLPDPVKRWLTRAGVVGRPRVTSARIRFDGLIRSGPGAGWMRGPVEQFSFFRPVGRYFFMRASRMGLPVHVYHRYAGGTASMEARLAGVIPILDVSGEVFTRSETVTVLNDLILFAPGAIPGLPLRWEDLGDGRVRVTLENAGHAVSADLTFDSSGDLAGFVSMDRFRTEGEDQRPVPWSTPVLVLGEVEGLRLPVEAEARWVDPDGEWAYARLTVRELAYNPTPGRGARGGSPPSG